MGIKDPLPQHPFSLKVPNQTPIKSYVVLRSRDAFLNPGIKLIRGTNSSQTKQKKVPSHRVISLVYIYFDGTYGLYPSGNA